MAETDEVKTTPSDILKVLRRQHSLFVAGAALFAFAALVAAQYWTLQYTGTTMFERRSDPAGQETAGRDKADSESIRLTLPEELKGRTALEKAVDELGPKYPELCKGTTRGPDSVLTQEGRMARQRIVQGLEKSIGVKFEATSDQLDRISVSFTHNDPDLAQEMPDTLVKNYILKTSEQIVERLGASSKFLKEQVDTADKRLTELTKQRIAFESQHAGKLPDNPFALAKDMDDVKNDIDTVRRQQTVAKQKLEQAKVLAEAATPKPDEPIQIVKGPNPKWAEIDKELTRFKDELDQAKTLRHMKETHPTVETLNRKIKALEEELKNTPEEVVTERVFDTAASSSKGTTDIKMVIASAQSEVDMTTNEMERLEKRLKGVQDMLADYAPLRQQYLELNQKVTDLEAEKDRWQKRLTEGQMALAAEVAKRRTHLNAIQMAEKQFRPSSPKLSYVLGLALAGGLAVGAGLVFLTNLLDRSKFTTRQEAETHFGLPVCGVIDEIATPTRSLWRSVWRRWRRQVIEPAVLVVLLVLIAGAGLNIVLWLQFPEQHKEWAEDPWSYVSRQVAEGAQKLRQAL
jgi:uncharacterized protein involved in exopolysaccharide biosynthesis